MGYGLFDTTRFLCSYYERLKLSLDIRRCAGHAALPTRRRLLPLPRCQPKRIAQLVETRSELTPITVTLAHHGFQAPLSLVGEPQVDDPLIDLRGLAAQEAALLRTGAELGHRLRER